MGLTKQVKGSASCMLLLLSTGFLVFVPAMGFLCLYSLLFLLIWEKSHRAISTTYTFDHSTVYTHPGCLSSSHLKLAQSFPCGTSRSLLFIVASSCCASCFSSVSHIISI